MDHAQFDMGLSPAVGAASPGSDAEQRLERRMARLFAIGYQSGCLHSFKITIILSLAAAVLNAVVGTLAAYALVRFSLPGRKLLDALVDLPLALPTAVTGLC
jgi:sulfate transport system permease protein